MPIQILNYEFLGPIRLSEWGPPMEKVVFLLFKRTKDTFAMIFADELEKTDDAGFFTKHEKFQCWIQNAGSEDNLYLSIYPMWDSSEDQRKKILQKIIASFRPLCNGEKN